MSRRKRKIFFHENYFEVFYNKQTSKVQQKIIWTLKLIEELDRIPETYLKHLEGTTGLYEIRVQVANNKFRVFCFFDSDNIIIVLSGFQKKSRKTPKREIERVEQIRRDYYANKK